jgi:high mobility group protein B1
VTLCLVEENQLNTGKGDPKKPRGKMSSYAFFVQTCREEHKKQHSDASVNFSEFSKKCSERWETMSAKENGNLKIWQKLTRLVMKMKTYISPKGETKKKFKDTNAPKRPPSAFFLFCSEYHPKIKGKHPDLSIGDVAKKLGEMWNNTAANDKQPCEKKAAKLKEKYEKDIAATEIKENLMQQKRGWSRLKRARKRRKRKMRGRMKRVKKRRKKRKTKMKKMMINKLILVQFFFSCL